MTTPQSRAAKPPGELGEDFVEWICQSPFGKDFLFRGQKYRDGPNEIELCDLLLLFDDTAVLMEVKTADLTNKAGWTEEQWADWANKRIQKALAQIERGVKALTSGLVKSVENNRQGCVTIDPARIRHIFGVVIVDHPTLGIWGSGPFVQIADRRISVLATTHSDLRDLFTELSTPVDFMEYLFAREKYFNKNTMFGITELDLLAFYKRDPEEFIRTVEQYDAIVIDEDSWKGFITTSARAKRAELDAPSRLVDAIIDRLYESQHSSLPHLQSMRRLFGQIGSRYVDIATELAKTRRVDRRGIGEMLFEKSAKCMEQNRPRWFACTPRTGRGTTFIFLVSMQNREDRLKLLLLLVLGAKLRSAANRVVGIATEAITKDSRNSVDAVLMEGSSDDLRKQLPPDFVNEAMELFGTERQPGPTEFGEPDEPSDTKRDMCRSVR